MAEAERELLAEPADVWRFLAEPYHLSDWWPGVVSVQPDVRGFSVGARWLVVRRAPRGLLPVTLGSNLGAARRETLVVLEIEEGRRLAFQLVPVVSFRLRPDSRPSEVAIELAGTAPGRTRVRVSVSSTAWGSRDAMTAATAAERLHELVQTAAGL